MKNSEFKRDDCSGIAPFLMELFDGEADEEAARRARAHLLVCQNCARAWFEWNNQRTFLRSESVPAPPPTLFWRILLACRLANKRQQAARRAWYWPFGREAEPRVAPAASETVLRGFEPHQAPSDLSARILAQTTRQAAPAQRFASITPVRRPRWLALPTLAAPALAAWLLVFQFDTLRSFTATLPATVQVPVALESKPTAVASVRHAITRVKIETTRPFAVVPKSLIKAAPVQPEERPRAEAPVREVNVEPRSTLRHHEEKKPFHEAVAREENVASAPAPHESFVRSVEWSPVETIKKPAVAHQASAKIVAAVAPLDTTPKPVPIEVSLPKPPAAALKPTLLASSTASRPVVVRLAELSLDDVETVRARPARVSKFALMPVRAVPNKTVATAKMRVSRPIATTGAIHPVSTAPVVDESQVDEMRDVVDGYRAALSDDNGGNSLDSGDMS